jgi:RNA polymerase sigma factor (sigma-70 family)
VRRYRDFASCEDAVQEALIAATQQWPTDGQPENSLAWLVRVASRRLTDHIRADAARKLREQIFVSLTPMDEQIAIISDSTMDEPDETLSLYFMSCHPSLTPSSQIALTLRAVGGLTTAEIARAFLVPEATMAQRLTRAKLTIKASGSGFTEPSKEDRAERVSAVLRVLYLSFNEGYMATSGDAVCRFDLSSEAIRVTRLLDRVLPAAPEVKGLLALMLLTDARRSARVGSSGELIPLDAQDRSKWNRADVDAGKQVLQEALALGSVGPYQVQACIAALHDEAVSTDSTDWAQIAELYEVLMNMAPSPMVRLSHAIAIAMVQGPAAGLAIVDQLETDARLAGNYRLAAARAHLLERLGQREQAVNHYRRAAAATTNIPERDYLLLEALTLVEG